MKAKNDTVLVVFRDEKEKLVNMFAAKFVSTNEARTFIEEDAAFYVSKHPSAKVLGWMPINGGRADYYCIKKARGGKLYYQYFVI